jgi:quinoprotein glucose dehydrogenase
MPRLVFLSIGALWLLWLAPSRLSVGTRLIATVVLLAAMAGLLGYSFFTVAAPADMTAEAIPSAVHPESVGEWTHYGNSLHATRYSDLAQITPANAANLEQAWVYHARRTFRASV